MKLFNRTFTYLLDNRVLRIALIATAALAAPLAAMASIAADEQHCDVKAGQKIFSKCAACHTNDSSGTHGAGPNLYGVVGRMFASVDGYPYSVALSSAKRQWTVAELDRFLQNPMATIPGTSMAFAGIRKEHQRRAVICFLQESAKGE